ncbi:MAG: STAS/SEC14 domain-containing protein [Chthoniobacteraceae bacterium]
MIEIISGTPDDLVVAVGHGRVTGDDYETALLPAIEERLDSYRRIRFLFQLARDFHGFSAEAVWDDAKLGLGHATEFEAVAIVTDVHWLIKAVEFFRFFIRFPVKAFTNEHLDEAMDWVMHATSPSLTRV